MSVCAVWYMYVVEAIAHSTHRGTEQIWFGVSNGGF